MKKILISFFKDKLTLTIGYFLNTIVILLYLYLSDTQKDILYPFFMSIIIYIFIMLNEWNKYYKFNRSFKEGIENRYFNLNPKTEEQKKAAEIIFSIHENYANKIGSINAQIENNRYLLSQWIHNIKAPTSIIDLIIQKAVKETSLLTMDQPIDKMDIIKLFFDIREENNKIRSSLNQILNLNRLNDFSKDLEPQEVDLVELLREIINNKKNQFIYNNIFPKIEFEYEKLSVITDRKWNKFMLDQIISNAIKYSGDSTIKKYIYFDICIDNEKIILSIKDEGIGIPSYDIKKVFEPFFTGENGRKVRDATGIGLYICKTISKELNHHISIESEVNKGTTLSITYPSKI